MIKILNGVYGRDGGELEFGGEAIDPRSAKEAEALGISTVFQEVNLIPTLSVAENIMLGRFPKRWGMIDWKAVKKQARGAMGRLGLEMDVGVELRSCSMAMQQMVAIARALDVRCELLILDEPTSSLDEEEVERLFVVLRQLRDQGLAILFVSHFLDQIYGLSDRMTVLRNGGLVGEYLTAELPRMALWREMPSCSAVPISGSTALRAAVGGEDSAVRGRRPQRVTGRASGERQRHRERAAARAART